MRVAQLVKGTLSAKKKKKTATTKKHSCVLGLTTVHLNWMSIASSGSEIYLHESFNSHPWRVHILDVLPALL